MSDSDSTVFKPRGFGQIVGDAFDVYFTDLPAFMGIAVTIILPLAVCGVILFAVGGFIETAFDGEPRLVQFLVTQWLRPFGVGLLGMLGYVLLNGALIHATGQKHNGLPISIRRACLAAFKNAGGLTGAYLVELLLYWAMSVSWICLPFALSEDAGWLYALTAVSAIGLPFAFYFSVKWSFVLQTVLLEGRGVTQAFPRSSDLVTGSWWRCLGIWGLLYFAPFVLGFSAVAFSGFVPGFATVLLLGVFVLVIPLSAVAQTLLYFDLHAARGEPSSGVLPSEMLPGAPQTPSEPLPERIPQKEFTAPWQPRRLNPLVVVVAVAVLVAALATPAVLLLPDYYEHGDIQVSVRRTSTGETVRLGDVNLETLDYTDFVLVVDNERHLLEPYFNGEGSWMKGTIRARVFTLEGTREYFLASGMSAEDDTANEIMVMVEYGGYDSLDVWCNYQGEFPSASQIVLRLEFYETGDMYVVRFFTV